MSQPAYVRMNDEVPPPNQPEASPSNNETVNQSSGTIEDASDIDWMPDSERPLDCPQGLQYLNSAYTVNIVENNSGCCDPNYVYYLANPSMQKMYNVLEDSSFCCLFWCSNYRSFEMKIMDKLNQPVITLKRPFRWFYQSLDVYWQGDQRIGGVSVKPSCSTSELCVIDEFGNPASYIKIPSYSGARFGDTKFKFLSGDRSKVVAMIHNPQIRNNGCTVWNKYSIRYTKDVSLKHKSLLLGSAFLMISLLQDPLVKYCFM